MKKLRTAIFITALAASLSGFADSQYNAAAPLGSSNEPEPEDSATAKYIKNLGLYLGYDVDEEGPAAFNTLLDYTLSVVSTGQQSLYTFFASIPVNSLFKTFTENTSYDSFNDQANAVFQDYASPGASSGVSVVENFDQQTYQQDPVSQSVLNILGTPDWSNCSSSDSSDTCLSIDKVMTTVLQDVTTDGQLPGEYDYYKSENNAKFLSQLNGNTLIAPLLYSTKTDDSQKTNGLPAKSQIEQAQDFIRYATEGVLPLPSMTQADYSKLFSLAYPPTDSEGNYTSDVDATNTMNAKVALSKYLLGLRVYAAKASVPISNLYHILGKRMAQKSSSSDGSSSATTSQALNEFKMATWRQYDPDKQSSDQWIQKINSASAATVQKEIAILLSDMNYQMYLARQAQERLLLTQSLLLLQQISTNKPDNGIPSEVDAESSSSSN